MFCRLVCITTLRLRYSLASGLGLIYTVYIYTIYNPCPYIYIFTVTAFYDPTPIIFRREDGISFNLNFHFLGGDGAIRDLPLQYCFLCIYIP